MVTFVPFPTSSLLWDASQLSSIHHSGIFSLVSKGNPAHETVLSVCLLITASIKMHPRPVSAKLDSRTETCGMWSSCQFLKTWSGCSRSWAAAWILGLDTEHTHTSTAPLTWKPKFFRDIEKGWAIQSQQGLELLPWASRLSVRKAFASKQLYKMTPQSGVIIPWLRKNP